MASIQQTPAEKARILQQQQQRLIYLRHASKCVHVDGRCPQGYHACGAMKDLWQHIAVCKVQRCQYSHCVSSRYILSHCHKCKDATCPVCAPVREARRRDETMASEAEGAKGDELIKTEEEEEEQTEEEKEKEKEALEDFILNNAPAGFLCPLSLALFKDPVLASDGLAYDKPFFLDWIEKCKSRGQPLTSPVTSLFIDPVFLPNHHLKSFVLEYRETKTKEYMEQVRAQA